MAENHLENLKQQLQKYLNNLEDSIEEICSVNSQLKNNVAQIRKEISQSVNYQKACIRARKRELLLKLENMAIQKEQKLFEQQEKVNQSIGAVKEILGCANINENEKILLHMISKISQLNLSVEETPHLFFECNSNNFQKNVSEFGRLVNNPNCKTENVSKTNNCESPNSFKASFVDEAEEEEFFARNRTQSSTSEFEIINRPEECPSTNTFSISAPQSQQTQIDSVENGFFKEHFTKINNLPTKFWLNTNDLENCDITTLLQSMNNVALKEPIFLHNLKFKENQKTEKFEFENVIQKIKRSHNDEWLYNEKRKKPNNNFEDVENCVEISNKKKKFWNPYGDKGNKLSSDHWAQWYRSSLNKTDEEFPQNNWQNISEWKNILENIHCNKEIEWLAKYN